MTSVHFHTGLDALLDRHASWLKRRRFALLSHPAALTRDGRSGAEALRQSFGGNLAALWGPEHGFFGLAGAGERVRSRRHPVWGIPVHSLYGQHRKPTPAMLKGISAIVVDLQDLGVRQYTYVSSLRLVMEAAAKAGKTVIVADRPIPLPRTVDGPMIESSHQSFVGMIPAPMSYGMTPAETAHWLKETLEIDVELKTSRMTGYHRELQRPTGVPWVPPSPGIPSWESAVCYPATVFCEALPALDFGRQTGLAFQIVGAPWIRPVEACKTLARTGLPGVTFHPHVFPALAGRYVGSLLKGIRLTVCAPRTFRPVTTSLALFRVLEGQCPKGSLWQTPGARPGFFDKLYGTGRVRAELARGTDVAQMAARWHADSAAFRKERAAHLLYRP